MLKSSKVLLYKNENLKAYHLSMRIYFPNEHRLVLEFNDQSSHEYMIKNNVIYWDNTFLTEDQYNFVLKYKKKIECAYKLRVFG